MSAEAVTLGDLTAFVRSKNAGPFWVTFDVVLRDEDAYRQAAAEGVVTPESIGELYDVAPEAVRIFRLPDLQIIKISFPRAVSQGSLHDRDMHAGQQHVPLTLLPLPG